ncbi:hypothetical protein [Henriciella aquimarina]|uniref:hypothetical protein n=1 Tax=Henriciella aquimarina TaxID=545261 RepID=UPI0009FFE88B|nr:hypothetical protein [Henriciella aquimarina]
MTKTVWKRPNMPEASKSGIKDMGLLLLAMGVGSTFIGGLGMNSGEPAGFPAVVAGGVMINISVLMIVLGVIVQEMRQAAFEAALRAGEVQTAGKSQ